jgi:hypothetical protein
MSFVLGIGNTERVAQNHYLQVTDAHFAKAVAEPLKNQPIGSSAAQNPAQSEAVKVGNDEDSDKATNENRPVLPSDSDQPICAK